MSGPELVALVLAALAIAWTAPGGSRVGGLALLVTAEAVVLGSATGTTLAPEVGWLGWDGALETILMPYGLAVALGWSGGAASGGAARWLRARIRRARSRGPAAAS